MKPFFFSLLFSLLALPSAARTLQLNLSNGTEVYYFLSSENPPVMKRTADGFTINTDGYAFSQFQSFTILKQNPDGIDALQHNKATFTQLQGQLTVVGQSLVRVYDQSGRLVLAAKALEGSNSVQLSLIGLPKGIYIAHAGESSFKFIKQ